MKFLELARAINHEQMLMERDVINAPDVKLWVKQLAQRATSLTGQQWVTSQVFDYLINKTEDRAIVSQVHDVPDGSPDWLVAKMQSGSPLYQVQTTTEFATIANGVIDWINEWTQDHPGARINYTWEQAVAAADEWHKELAKGAQYGDEDPNDEGLATVKVYPDGMRWVIVRSKACLSREGGRMGHCVGGYYPKVESGEVMILSLRSAKNTPHVTIEVGQPNLDWWNHVMAELNRDQMQYQFDFMKMNPAAGDTLGEIHQIKGKQNKAPVEKYVPYVVDLVTKLPFAFSSGGTSDLSQMGWYVRRGKVVPLKSIAKVYAKYPSGFAWITVPEDPDERRGGSSLRYTLVDKAWATVMSTNVYLKAGEEVTMASHFSFSGDGTPYREYVLDFIKKKESQGVRLNYSGVRVLGSMGIYIGAKGIGELEEAAEFGANLPKSGFQVYHVQSLIKSNNTYSNILNPVPTIFDQTGAPLGEVEIVERYRDDPDYAGPGHRGVGAGKAIVKVTFMKPYEGDHQALMIELSQQLRYPLMQPELYGLDDRGKQIDVTEGAELLGESANTEYQYFLAPSREEIIVVGNGLHVPLAVIEVEEDANGSFEPSGIKSGFMDANTDAGLFGYVLIDLSKQQITDTTMVTEYDMMDRGWIEYYRDWIYAEGGRKLQVTLTTTITDEAGEETEEVTESLLHQVDEMVIGAENDSYLPNYASVIRRGTYRDRQDDFGDNGLEVREYVLELDDSRNTRALDFASYDRSAVERLMR